MENNEQKKPQPILIKLDRSKKDKQKKIIIILSVIIVLLLISFGLYYFNNKRNQTTKKTADDKQATISTTTSSNETTEKTDPYAFIYETTLPTYIDKKGTVHEITEGSDPEEYEKVEEYFGPLPEAKKKANFEHQKIRGVYIYDTDNLDSLLAEIKGTEVNAIIIDVKESWGLLYDSKVPLAKELDAIITKRDIKAITEKCHAQGLRVIARVVAFKDLTLAEKRPDLTIHNADGAPIQFSLESDSTWANPYNQELWQYLIDIAKEVIEFGVDEIQFDYIRFPAGGAKDGSAADYGEPETVPQKYSAINRFLQTVVIEVQDDLNTPVGADLFSIVMTSDLDGHAIGQDWKTIGLTGINNICPMIYPSHYANGSQAGSMANGVGTDLAGNRYTAPDNEPYGVVRDAIIDGREAIDQQGYAHVRPYLQAFTATYLPAGYWKDYTGPVIREQMKAVYESGIEEWILWNVQESYPEGTFEKN